MIARSARTAGWCALLVVGSLVVFLGLGITAGLTIGEAVAATCVTDLAILLGGLILRRKRPDWFRADDKPTPMSTGETLALIGTMVTVFFGGQAVAAVVYETVGSSGFDSTVDTRSAAPVILVLAVSFFLAPAGEEMLFRGLLYPLLRRRASIITSALLSALAFALIHGNLVQAIAVVPVGIVLALVYERTQSLWACIGLHMAYNIAVILTPNGVIEVLTTPIPLVVVAMLALAALTLFSTRHAIRPRPTAAA